MASYDYPNGEFPKSLFVVGRTGTDDDGYWEHWYTPGLYQKWVTLQERCHAKTGKWLALSTGWSAYRPYGIQVDYQRIYGRGAAHPGTSSHGGRWEGDVCFALDIGNWGSVYGYDRAAFFADCRAVGLTPDMISERRGYPDEPWHVIDFDPWRLGSALDTPKSKVSNPNVPVVSTPTNPKTKTLEELFEEALMSAMMSGFYYTTTVGGKATTIYLIVNNLRGTYHEYSAGAGNGTMSSAYNNPLASALGTGSFASITESHAKVIKRQNRAADGADSVTIVNAADFAPKA